MRGGERMRERQQAKARSSGCIYKWRKLVGGRWERNLGGRRSVPGEEVGSGYNREVMRLRTYTDGGAIGRSR